MRFNHHAHFSRSELSWFELNAMTKCPLVKSGKIKRVKYMVQLWCIQETKRNINCSLRKDQKYTLKLARLCSKFNFETILRKWRFSRKSLFFSNNETELGPILWKIQTSRTWNSNFHHHFYKKCDFLATLDLKKVMYIENKPDKLNAWQSYKFGFLKIHPKYNDPNHYHGIS